MEWLHLPRRCGRACVLYDQLGCGRSELLPDAPAELWTPQLSKDELVELTRQLGIADRYPVVGQSWGGMLAMEHALDHPPGLRAIVLAGQIHERIPGSTWVLFEQSSHMPHVEEPDAFLETVEAFLQTID